MSIYQPQHKQTNLDKTKTGWDVKLHVYGVIYSITQVE